MADTAKTTVSVLIFLRRGESILLVRQNYGKRYWSLPGGVMEAGESLEQAAMREVREETGLEVQLGRLVGVYSKPGEAGLALTFEGQVTGGKLQADHEILEVQYFPLEALPENVRGHLRQRVEDYSAGHSAAVVRTQ